MNFFKFLAVVMTALAGIVWLIQTILVIFTDYSPSELGIGLACGLAAILMFKWAYETWNED